MRGDRLERVKVSVDERRLSTGGSSRGQILLPLTTDVSRWHLLRVEAPAPGASLAELWWKPAGQVKSQNAKGKSVGSDKPGSAVPF